MTKSKIANNSDFAINTSVYNNKITNHNRYTTCFNKVFIRDLTNFLDFIIN